jgi:hypothetical protein
MSEGDSVAVKTEKYAAFGLLYKRLRGVCIDRTRNPIKAHCAFGRLDDSKSDEDVLVFKAIGKFEEKFRGFPYKSKVNQFPNEICRSYFTDKQDIALVRNIFHLTCLLEEKAYHQR